MDYVTESIAHPGQDPLEALIAKEENAQQIECKIVGVYFDSLDGNINIEVEELDTHRWEKRFYVNRKLQDFNWLMLTCSDIIGKECLLDKRGPDAKIIEIY